MELLLAFCPLGQAAVKVAVRGVPAKQIIYVCGMHALSVVSCCPNVSVYLWVAAGMHGTGSSGAKSCVSHESCACL